MEGFQWLMSSGLAAPLIWDIWLLLSQWIKWLPRPYGADPVAPSNRTASHKNSVPQAVQSKPTQARSPIPEGGMYSDRRSDPRTGVYKWAGGAILEDWNCPPAWFTEPFLEANRNNIPAWLLDLYEKWANGEGFYIGLFEIEARLTSITDPDLKRATRFAFSRLVRQPGFQWYPKRQEYGFIPGQAGRGEDMGKANKLVPLMRDTISVPKLPADFSGDLNAESNGPQSNSQESLLRSYLEARAQQDQPWMDPQEAAQIARALGKQYREMMQQLSSMRVLAKVAEANSGIMFNGDPNKGNSSLTIEPMGRPIGEDEIARQEPRIPTMPPLKPILGLDTTTAANVRVRTPKNSSKAAWSSSALRVLQGDIATYDAEVAQLFVGLAQVMSQVTRNPVKPEDLDFDVNFGSPILDNTRQLSITIRKPTPCRVSIKQQLQPNGGMTWNTEVWDMSGIPDGSRYMGKYSKRFEAEKPSVSDDVPPPKKDLKRPRQVRI